MRQAKHRKAVSRSRAENPRNGHEVGGRKYRDIFERLYANSFCDPSIGIFIDEKWSPCWLWLGKVNRYEGYPQITVRRRKRGKNRPVPILAHRLSHELHMGVKLLKSEQLRHLCNTPRCIHPNHTLPGTAVENTADQYARGTHVNQRAEREPGEDDE